MKKLFLILLGLLPMVVCAEEEDIPNTKLIGCSYKEIRLQGKVKVVESFPDIKVQVVTAFPDIKVQVVRSFPDDCGEWQFVDAFPDFTIQYVTSFPDLKIQFVDAFPGVN